VAILGELRRTGHANVATVIAPLLDQSIGLYVSNENRSATWIVLPEGKSMLHSASSPAPEGLPLESGGSVVTPEGAPVP
jgi:hypothetical protein